VNRLLMVSKQYYCCLFW